MRNRAIVLVGVLVSISCISGAQEKPKAAAPADATSGKQTYMNYCASCHGNDGRGHGPAAASLKTTLPDLRTLAMRHDGKFPEGYVASVVRSGNPSSGHGGAEMPVWGPVFTMQANGDEAAVSRRVKGLCDYLASIQDKKS